MLDNIIQDHLTADRCDAQQSGQAPLWDQSVFGGEAVQAEA